MDKGQAQHIVRQTLQNDFDKERFLYFIKNLLNSVDESKALQKLSGNYIKEAFRPYIDSYERLATYTDPTGSEIDVLIVYLLRGTSLGRARTAQRNFVARYLKDRDQKDAALVAFVSPDPADWRFSLVKMAYSFGENGAGVGKVNQEFTPARRWSFLVGKNENSHTAQSRLSPLVEDDEANVTLKEIEDAFNIEKVTKEFFEKYRDLYLRVHDTLEEVAKASGEIKRDFAAKQINTVDFAKKLLGQVVFLYFLQKKGWFGVPMKGRWGDGNKQFLRTLFEEAATKGKNYFNDYLEPLFYEALAKERDEDYYSRFECRIPFLNGGLFDPIGNYDWVNTDINLPQDIFSNGRKTKDGDIGDGILDIFDRYNFTVKEDEPLEREVAVDPEMLGKVFENLLEIKDRKSKGTYYTPREIVNYMCEESVANYLATELDGRVSRDDVEQLIKIGESVAEHEATYVAKKENDPDYAGRYAQVLPPSVEEFADAIDRKLATIKVCDPAIGSGAFPVGMMNVIVRARTVLSSYMNGKRRTSYGFKRDCIQNSLYGVDIDPGAVEIAKLRLWLSLVVDEDDIKQVKPLPNLDYKIMQGNSLIEEFEGIRLFDESLIAAGDGDKEAEIEVHRRRQAVLQKEYLHLHSKGRLGPARQAELGAELKKLKRRLETLTQPAKLEPGDGGLFDVYSEAKRKAVELKRLHKEFFEVTQKSQKDSLRKQIEELEWGLIEATLREQNKLASLKKLEQFKKSNTRPFFLWKLNFAEVFEAKGGFDVLLANPPYGITYDEQLKDMYEKAFTAFGRNNDIYVAFYEHGIGILKQNGSLTYITPNTYLNGDYFKEIRRIITGKTKIIEIIDYKEIPIFADPTVFVSILSCIKQEHIAYPYSYTIKTPRDSIESLDSSLVSIASETDGKLKGSNAVLVRLLAGRNVEILDKMFYVKDVGFNYWTKGKGKKRDGNSIGDRVFYSGARRNAKDVPFLKGRDIQKYVFRAASNYLKWDYEKYLDRADTLRFSKDFLRLRPKLIYRQTADHIVAALDAEANYLDKTVHLIVPKENTTLDLKCVLGVLNSKLIDYLYKYISQEREGRTFSQVKTTYIKQIPLPMLSAQEQDHLLKLVNKILDITKAEGYFTEAREKAKVTELEHRIDELVYKLYGLTGAEIEIVEGKQSQEFVGSSAM